MKLNRISLNTIGLNRIGLNRIGSPSRGSSSGSVRPYIDPEVLASLVAVCICDGKSNDDPDRAIIKNLVDPDNPFVISNAAYKLNSGFGKYEVDFTTWYKQSGVSSEHNKFTIISNDISYNNNYIGWSNANLGDVPKFKIKISGIKDGVTVAYKYYKDNVNISTSEIRMNKDGIYDLPYSYSIGGSQGFVVTDGKDPRIIGITIEQIPSFQGALVTDGVNDLIASTKTMQEMLDGSNEMTVVSMIHQIAHVDKVNNLSYNNYFRNSSPSFIRNNVMNIGKTGIYGYKYATSNTSTVTNILGDKNDYSNTVTNEKPFTSRFFVEGWALDNGTIAEVSQVAWYWTFIAKKALTTDEINQVIAYYNLDKYVKPDVYYDVKKQGLSNNTPDADWYMKDFSGNGRDMQLYNYAKTPESGINEEGGLQSDGITDYGQFVGDLGLKDYTIAVDRAYPSIKNSGVPVCSDIKGSVIVPFLFELANTNSTVPHSFGKSIVLSPMELNRKISYQSTYIYNGKTIIKGTATNKGEGLTIGRFGVDKQYANIALWSLLLFPYTLSEFLLERQLKMYNLGTLYPDMVEFRPIVKSNIPYKQIDYFIRRSGSYVRLNPGDYFSSTEDIIIRVTPIRDWQLDVISSIKVNGKDEVINVSSYTQTDPIHIDKSPQKIDITIDEYIRYEDIVQPYPTIFRLTDVDNNKEYTYGDKLKIGNKVKIASVKNLLPELYSPVGKGIYNGDTVVSGNVITVEKTMTFGWSKPFIYLKANEPNCIADPQRLRIPNSSYKILGYIPDISGHGNHLKINNSAYAGMSGANGYKYDWNTWTIVGGSNVERTDSLFTNKLAITAPTWGLLPPRNTVTGTFKIKVEGLKTGNIYWTYRESEETYKQFYIYNDGEYELPAPISESDGTGFIFNTGTNAGVIVRQIGKYEGSFCLDGVEDFITIPTLASGVKQVLMKVNWNSINTIAYDHRNGVGNNDRFAIYLSDINEAIAYNARNSGQTYIDGILNTNIIASQLKDITHNITITNNDVNASNSGILRIGSAYTNSLYTQMALFTFMSFDDISSEEEIKELNDIVGIEGGYVESPDYYWDAYGKSNKPYEDIDYGILGESVITRNRIFDKSVEGLKVIETGNVSDIVNRALTANNFAFSEESGYVDNGLVSDGVDDHLINTIIPAFTDFTVISKRKFLNTELKLNETFCMKGDNAYLGGVGNAFVMEYYYGTDPTSKQSQMLSFGLKNIVSREESDITWCTPTSYNNITINRGEGGDTVGLSIGKYSKVYWKGVFYKMMLYSKTIDMLSINMLKNLFAKDELIDVNNPIFKQNN